LLLTVGLRSADILAQVYYALPYTRSGDVGIDAAPISR